LVTFMYAYISDGNVQIDFAGSALERIRAAIDVSASQVGEIALSARDMARGAQTVNESMQSISAVIEENTAATEEMAAQAGDVDRASRAIAQLSSAQAVTIDELASSADVGRGHVEEMGGEARQMAEAAERRWQSPTARCCPSRPR